MKRISVLLTIMILVLTGCTFNVASSSNEASGEINATSEEIGSEGTSDTTDQTLSSFTASVRIDQVDVHTNPGNLFPSLTQLNKGDEITVLSKAPGDEWLYVQLPDESTGWILSFLVQTDNDLSNVPTQKPEDAQVVSGQLRTENGEPIDGVQFSLIQSSSSEEQRTDATTDENGNFIAFIPIDAAGEWIVSYAAISCTSTIYDSNCDIRAEFAGTVTPSSQIITLPDPDLLEFVWK